MAGASYIPNTPINNSHQLTFRVAVVVALILRALAGIAPAAITVSVIPTQVDLILNFANLTGRSDDIADNYYFGSNPFVTSRAASIVQVEQLDGKLFGYNITQNYIIPIPTNVVPNLNTGMLNTTQYRTDVVHFDYSWMLPDKFTNISVLMAGVEWTAYDNPALDISVPLDSGIFPLIPYTQSPDNLTEYNLVNATSLSAYLFAQDDTADGITLDNGIPTIPSTTFYDSIFSNINSPHTFTSGTFLVCDPQPTYSSATIRLSPDFQLEVDVDNGASVGNIPQNVSHVIFSTSMLDATSQQTRGTQHMFLANIAYSLFIGKSLQTDSGASTLTVKSLGEINQGLNAFFLSASKAFANGYRPQLSTSDTEAPPIISYSNVSVSATQQLNVALGLTGTHPAFYATIELVILAVILTSFLHKGWRQEKNYPFSIDTMMKEGLIRKSV